MKGRDIRKMPWPARIRYLWDYYKVPIFTAAILLYILFYILWRFATRQDQVLFAAAVNAPISQETLDLMEAFPASSYGPGEGKDRPGVIDYTGNLVLLENPSADDHAYVYASRMKILASIEAEKLDLVIGDQRAMESFAEQGFLLPLTDIFGSDPRIGARLTEETVIIEDNHIEALLDDDVAYHASTRTEVCAIDLAGLPLLDSPGGPDLYLGIISNSPRQETAVSFVRYLFSLYPSE